MASIFRPSRIIAIAIVAGVALWVVSGRLGPGEGEPDAQASLASTTDRGTAADAGAAADAVEIPVQKVSIATAESRRHDPSIVLSCVTEAENRATAVARGDGVLLDLAVKRGDKVESGQVIGHISDEGRQSAVLQAQALLDQRIAEYTSTKTLIDRGNAPSNQLPALEAAVAAARAALAASQAQAERSLVKSPIAGVVDSVPAQVGQAVQIGMEIARIVDPDPMLAVGSVSESRRNSIQEGQEAVVRLVSGAKVTGVVDYVSLTADTATRTYPVEATIPNHDKVIADGVTCEMSVALAPTEATSIPRSALVFSDEGRLGVRTVGADGHVAFVPVEIVDDAGKDIWVSGLEGKNAVIVVGQDFVQAGDLVEAVPIDASASASSDSPA